MVIPISAVTSMKWNSPFPKRKTKFGIKMLVTVSNFIKSPKLNHLMNTSDSFNNNNVLYDQSTTTKSVVTDTLDILFNTTNLFESSFVDDNAISIDNNRTNQTIADDKELSKRDHVFDRTDVRVIFITMYSLVFCCCFFGKCKF